MWESHAEDGYDGPDLEFPHTIAPVEEEAWPALGPVALDMLRESRGLLLPLPALPPPEVICGSSDWKLLIQRLMEAMRPGRAAPTLVPGLDGGIDPSSPVPLEPVLEEDHPSGIGCVFLLWSPGTWGGPMLKNRHFVSLFVGWLVGWCQKWPLPSGTDEGG